MPPLDQAPLQPAQAPGVDLNAHRLTHLGDVQQRTAEEYSKRINQSPSYKVDSITEDGVVVRGQVTFHRTDGADRAGGGYFSGADGVRHHNTGTSDDGRVIAGHRVERDGSVRMSRGQGPTVFTSELNDLIDQLGLKQDHAGSLTFSRRGFPGGKYTIQIEDNGSFSVHYAGGVNAAGERCYAQTYHRGRWDESRAAMLSEASQQERWTKRNARENGDNTAVSTTHHEPVAKATSGFHTSTSSSVVDSDGKLTAQAAPITTEAIRTNIAKITADSSTWSGTYVYVPGAEGQPAVIPPSYSFACQHNNTSGILNIKQATLDTLAGEQTLIKSVYTLAVNSYDESNAAGQGFRSLLTDKKMLLSDATGKETVVTLCGNGDVIDHTNGFKYSIQVKDGQPISWTKAAYVEQTNQPALQGAPQPSAAPDLGAPSNQTTPTTVDRLTEEGIAAEKKANQEAVPLLASKLLTENKASTIVIDPSIKTTTYTDERIAISSAVKVTVGEEHAYAFSRQIRADDKTLQGGILFVRQTELSNDTSQAAKVVANTYSAMTQADNSIKIEEWHVEGDTKTRIRSDGSIEMHKTDSANTVYSIIAPYKKDGGGLEWKVIPAELDAQGRLIKEGTAPTTTQVQESAQTTTTTTTTQAEVTPEKRTEAREYATLIYSSIQAGNRFSEFESTLKEIQSKGLSELMLEEYTKLGINNSQSSIAAHYYEIQRNKRDDKDQNIEFSIKKISLACEPESNKELVEAAYDLYYRLAGATNNEGLASFALIHRNDWPELERIFDKHWSSFYSGNTKEPIMLKQAMGDELGLTTTMYQSIQHFVSGNPQYKFDPMSVASQMRGMIKGFRIDDNEEAFVNLVEMTAEQGRLKEVEAELQRLHSFTFKGIIESEGFSRDQLTRLNQALKGHTEIKIPEEYVPSSDGPMMMM